MQWAAAVAVATALVASQGANGATGQQSDALDVQIAEQQAQSKRMLEPPLYRASSGAATRGQPNRPSLVVWDGCGQRLYTEAELRQMLAPQFVRYPGRGAAGPWDVDLSKEYANPMDLLSQLGEARAFQYAQLKYANDPEMLKAYLNALNGATGRATLEAGPAEGQVRLVNGDNAILPGQGIAATLDTAGLNAEVARRLAAQQAEQRAYESDPRAVQRCRQHR